MTQPFVDTRDANTGSFQAGVQQRRTFWSRRTTGEFAGLDGKNVDFITTDACQGKPCPIEWIDCIRTGRMIQSWRELPAYQFNRRRRKIRRKGRGA